MNVDCEQSLFSSKIRGEECKTSRASVPVSVTYVRASMPQGASSAGVGKRAASPLAHHAHRHASTLICFAFLPAVFEEKRDCSQSSVNVTYQGQAKHEADLVMEFCNLA